MFIQIDFANYINKGAELMLYSVTDYLEKNLDNPQFVLGNSWYSREDLGNSGLYKRLGLELFGYPIDKFLPKKIRKFAERRGLVRTSEVKIVLNAAGYYFRDGSFGISRCAKKEVHYYKNLKRNKSKVILLPQAFGPLKTKEAQQMVSAVFEYVDLAFARDAESYKSLVECLGSDKKVRLAPDFTNLYKVENMSYKAKKIMADVTGDYAVVIPNFNMFSVSDKEKYLNFLSETVNNVLASGKKVVVLNHERDGDKPIIDWLADNFKDRVVIADNLDANDVKYIISKSYLTMTSRFHGLVSALSSGVPALCTSWSHKYEELLADYHFKDAILNPGDMVASMEKVNFYLRDDNNSEARKNLLLNSEIQQARSKKMWLEVVNFIKNDRTNY